jgi:mannan endo-1,4-beta-mannosidase
MKAPRVTALLASAAVAMPVAAVCAALAGMHSITPAGRAAGSRSSPAVLRVAPARKVLGVVTSGSVTAFEHDTGTRVGLAVRYLRWGQPYPLEWARALEARKIMPLAEIEPRGISMTAVASGQGDEYLRRLSRMLSAVRGKVALSFAPEANGRWYSWGGRPVLYVRAWRRVVTEVGDRRQVTWVWIMHHSARLAAYWPGRRYVTWAGIDGYFERPRNTFSSLFAASIRAVRRLAPVPVLLSEAAAGPGTRHQARDIRQLFTGMRRWHLLGLVWFDIAQHDPPFHQDWRLEDDPAALRAYRKAASAFLR